MNPGDASGFAALVKARLFPHYGEPYDPLQEADLLDHLGGRVEKFRRLYAPWIRSRCPSGATVLEVGVGSGCSSQVLSESGYILDGIEPLPDPLAVAVERLRIHGLSFRAVMQRDFPAVLADIDVERYDAIFFWASLEHMTIEERVTGLEQIWKRMKAGAQVFILECPNRLWLTDSHTGGAEFYHWLPDTLLIRSGIHSFRNEIELYRGGRGASFHELRLSGIPVGKDAAIDSLQLWWRRKSLLRAAKWLVHHQGRYERYLQRHASGIHRAFFHEYLDVAIRK